MRSGSGGIRVGAEAPAADAILERLRRIEAALRDLTAKIDALSGPVKHPGYPRPSRHVATAAENPARAGPSWKKKRAMGIEPT
jgi:hypothetical protein